MGNTELVEFLEREGYIRTRRVKQAFLRTDRMDFVLQKGEAYQDRPLPTLRGQTISAPHMVAIMAELLELKGADSVLEVGAGSGYSAAIMGRLAAKVLSVEFFPELAETARMNLRAAGVSNVEVALGNGLEAPGKWDKVAVACAVPEVPSQLLGKLKDPGLLVVPVGIAVQELVLVRKSGGRLLRENHGGCVFVPLQEK